MVEVDRGRVAVEVAQAQVGQGPVGLATLAKVDRQVVRGGPVGLGQTRADVLAAQVESADQVLDVQRVHPAEVGEVQAAPQPRHDQDQDRVQRVRVQRVRAEEVDEQVQVRWTDFLGSTQWPRRASTVPK